MKEKTTPRQIKEYNADNEWLKAAEKGKHTIEPYFQDRENYVERRMSKHVSQKQIRGLR